MNLSNDQVIHQVKDGVEFLQFRRLLDFQDKLTHAYSLGINVNYRTAKPNKEPLSGQEYQVRKNDYDALSKAIGWETKQIVKTNQEHTDEIKIVKQKEKRDEPDWNLNTYHQTDGLITNQKNMLLATTNADCLLLLFYDPVTNTIANVHSGWRGTIQKIAEKTVEKMKKQFNCQAENIICCLSPSIRMCHFEVGEEVKNNFVHEFKRWADPKNWLVEVKAESNEQRKIPKWKIDTAKLNTMMLEKQGLKTENIIDCGICSMCHSDQIHSYRVEKQEYGLETALIGMKR